METGYCCVLLHVALIISWSLNNICALLQPLYKWTIKGCNIFKGSIKIISSLIQLLINSIIADRHIDFYFQKQYWLVQYL